jgi:hypothetical protein
MSVSPEQKIKNFRISDEVLSPNGVRKLNTENHYENFNIDLEGS